MIRWKFLDETSNGTSQEFQKAFRCCQIIPAEPPASASPRCRHSKYYYPTDCVSSQSTRSKILRRQANLTSVFGHPQHPLIQNVSATSGSYRQLGLHRRARMLSQEYNSNMFLEYTSSLRLVCINNPRPTLSMWAYRRLACLGCLQPSTSLNLEATTSLNLEATSSLQSTMLRS